MDYLAQFKKKTMPNFKRTKMLFSLSKNAFEMQPLNFLGIQTIFLQPLKLVLHKVNLGLGLFFQCQLHSWEIKLKFC